MLLAAKDAAVVVFADGMEEEEGDKCEEDEEGNEPARMRGGSLSPLSANASATADDWCRECCGCCC